MIYIVIVHYIYKLCYNILGEVSASITPPVGELIRAVTMSETKWDVEQKKLRGMTEVST